ncbi:MAG: hypothetical protein H6834_12125 [Planctomycetes bacterium]|nr:hypothetical protein [Planctomycetota bacterium]
MTLLSYTQFPACAVGDTWALGNYMLVARRAQGFSVIDATDPRNPVATTINPPNFPATGRSYGVGDIKSDGRYIYATDEWVNGGIWIYDSQPDPMNPTLVGHALDPQISTVHNCWIDGPNDMLYCVSRGRVHSFDVSNHASPQYVAQMGSLSGASAHDVIVLDDVAYCSLWGAGIALYDVSTPSAPQLIAHQPYSNSATHNMWPSKDRRYLYTTDENVVSGAGGGVRVWDIQNPSNIQQVGFFHAGAVDSVVHNTHVIDDLMFVTFYKEGLRVLSLKDPVNPVEIAHYDSFVPTGAGCFGGPYAGVWGVYAWDATRVFVSDMDNGAYILELDVVPHQLQNNGATVPPGGLIDLNLDTWNATTTDMNAFTFLILDAVGGGPVFAPLVIDAQVLAAGQHLQHPFPIPVPAGAPTGITLDFLSVSGTYDPIIASEITRLQVTIQ